MRICAAIVLLIASAVVAADESVGKPRLLDSRDLPIEVEQEVLQRQFDVLQAMQLDTLTYSLHGPVSHINGDTGVALPSDVGSLKEGDSAAEILQLFKDVLLATGDETLTVTRNSFRNLRFSQSIRGTPVIGGGVAIDYDDVTKRATSLAANFIPDRGLPRRSEKERTSPTT
jgi:hypothetical protein